MPTAFSWSCRPTTSSPIASGFLAAVRGAAEVAGKGKLVLFGIKPNAPHTGYGYIRRGAPLPGFEHVFAVDAFTEKPNAETASAVPGGGQLRLEQRHFRAEGACLSRRTVTSGAGLAGGGACRRRRRHADLGFLRLDAQAFAKVPNISVDYAVMERTQPPP